MKQTEHARRRKQLMRMMGKHSIAIVPAATERVRSRDTNYPFRQDSDFRYLTGFPEPDAVAVLIPGRKAAEYVLFCRDRDPHLEAWNGRRAGPEGAVNDYGADDAFPIDDIDDILPGLLEQCERVYYAMGVHPEFDQRVIAWVNQVKAQAKNGLQAPQEFVALDHLLHDMRLYKSRAEVALMRKAAKVSVEAHRRAMQICEPGKTEYEVEAEILHVFHRHGGEPAYGNIVGGGANSCILHYVENRDVLNDGELLLIDAGCELEGYASDITRTFPINGRFTDAQRQIYDIVLKAQQAGIDKARSGNHFNQVHEACVKALTKGLIKLGFLKGTVAQCIKDESYKQFYLHRSGHWLGLDVHDVGDYRVGEEWRVLEPGMVITVEPGLYIPAGTKGVPKAFWNTGVRIEDDVLITRDEPDVLTGGLLKDADAIEAFMAEARLKSAG